MFADLALAARIESAEASLTAAVVRAMPDAGAQLIEIAGGVAAWARAGSPMNKAIGFGFRGPVGGRDVEVIAGVFRSVGEPARLELSTLVDPSILTAFTSRGFALQSFEHVLGLPLQRIEGGTGEIVVERVAPAESRDWGEVAVEGFLHPDGTGTGEEEFPRQALETVMHDFARAPAMRGYVARIDGVAAGAASCHFSDGLAQLCGAATLPAFRRRGVQRALLAARLADARAAGCDLAVVTTAPGSQSQANVQRQGFTLLYARAILGT